MQMMQHQQMQRAGQQLAAQGRNGDTQIAHMTPGEISVPPQVQSPKVLATLKHEFAKKGTDISHAQVGNPASSRNPATGLPEYNFMSMFLPAALGIAGSLAMPGIGTALGVDLGSAAAASAIGGGLGSTAGGLLSGESPMQAGLSGLGSAAGGYALGGGLSGAGSSMSTDQVAKLGANFTPAQIAQMPGGAAALGQSAGNAAGGAMGPPMPGWSNLWGNIPGYASGAHINPLSAVGSAVGGALGNAIGAPAKSVGPQLPPGFNTPLTPTSQLPSFQQQLGYNTYKGPTPNFTGYNPQTNNPGAFNFYGT